MKLFAAIIFQLSLRHRRGLDLRLDLRLDLHLDPRDHDFFAALRFIDRCASYHLMYLIYRGQRFEKVYPSF